MQQVTVQQGQCGLCTHFGENSPSDQIIQIRSKHTAPENFVTSCGLPQNAAVELKVTPLSGCAGFESAEQA